MSSRESSPFSLAPIALEGRETRGEAGKKTKSRPYGSEVMDWEETGEGGGNETNRGT